MKLLTNFRSRTRHFFCQPIDQNLATKKLGNIVPRPANPTHYGKGMIQGFPDSMVVKNPSANTGDAKDMGSIPGSGRYPGGGNGNQLQYSFLGKSMDRGTWWAVVQGVTKSQAGFSMHAKNNAVACTEAIQRSMLGAVVRSSDQILKGLDRFKPENSMKRFL